jgi:sn-glycerol 3-phosphate transport system substrate-binding protein
VGGGNLYIVKGKSPERQKQAWKLIRWLTQPERLAQFSIDTGYVAPTKSSYETEVMKEYVKTFPQALTARDQLQYASASFATHAKGEVGKILTSALQSAIVGGADPDAALKKAQEEADKILAQFKK